ncbi:MAG: adenylate/guanylate cyclase domain-containing protein [Elainellaceae cyanobacterium]
MSSSESSPCSAEPSSSDIHHLQQHIAVLEHKLSQVYSAHQCMDDELRASQLKMRSLLQAIPDLIIVLNAEGVYVDFIEAKGIDLLVPQAEHRLGKTVFEVLPQELAQRYMETMQAALATGETQVLEYELEIYEKTGFYEARVVAYGEDEVVFIVRNVTERRRMETALALERDKSEKLLLNVLPKAIAEQLKQNQGAIAKQFDEATILFADIVGFTQLSSNLSATTVVNLLNQLFSRFDILADRYELEKIKTIGDAYMIVGGLPLKQTNHAEAIARIALEMLREAQQFASESEYPIQIRIGINTGPVVAGVIGMKKFIYDLWGDAVNVASRMESSGIANSIQVTESTYQKIRHEFHCVPRGAIEVKGKGQMPTYFLVEANESHGVTAES